MQVMSRQNLPNTNFSFILILNISKIEREGVERPREILKLSSFFNGGTPARNKSPLQLVELKVTGERDQSFPLFILARQEVNLLAKSSIFSNTPR